MLTLKIKNDICLNQKPLDNLSVSTLLSSEESSDIIKHQEVDFPASNCDRFYRAAIFSLRPGVKKLGPKATRSAISWIQTNSWIKNFDLDTTILSIILFYAYCSGHTVDKSKLELIICACMFLAKKYLARPPMELAQAMGMLSGNFSKQQFLEIQIEISTLLEFDFHFDHTVHELTSKKLSEEEEYQCKFLIQILLLKDHQILFNSSYLEQVIELTKDLSQQALLPIVADILKCEKHYQGLINKYRSHILIDDFVERLLESHEKMKRFSA